MLFAIRGVFLHAPGTGGILFALRGGVGSIRLFRLA